MWRSVSSIPGSHPQETLQRDFCFLSRGQGLAGTGISPPHFSWFPLFQLNPSPFSGLLAFLVEDPVSHSCGFLQTTASPSPTSPCQGRMGGVQEVRSGTESPSCILRQGHPPWPVLQGESRVSRRHQPGLELKSLPRPSCVSSGKPAVLFYLDALLVKWWPLPPLPG